MLTLYSYLRMSRTSLMLVGWNGTPVHLVSHAPKTDVKKSSIFMPSVSDKTGSEVHSLASSRAMCSRNIVSGYLPPCEILTEFILHARLLAEVGFQVACRKWC